MAKAGRKPGRAAMTEQEQRARGNPGRRKKAPAKPRKPARSSSSTDALQSPKWMNEDALRVWHLIAPRVEAMIADGHEFHPLQIETLARYCTLFARYLRIQKMMDSPQYEPVYTVTDGAGNVVWRANQLQAESIRIEGTLLAMEARLSLHKMDLGADRKHARAAGFDPIGALKTREPVR